MSQEEWERTKAHRAFLAFEVFGLHQWGKLTNAEKDEAVRRQAAGRDGERYARACLEFRGVGGASVPPLVSRRAGGDAGHTAGCPRDHVLTEACFSAAAGARAGA